MNAVPTAVLRTPLLHRLLSGRYLLLTFTGRSTGLLGHLVHGVPGYRRAAGLRAKRGGRVSAAELVRAVTEERRVFAVQVLA
ncbi:hypothetical protein [Ruania albidiflava]|uniref:hypothetical protein n=1 Tax=Ruania albidiflava TaxID=366586 RepID=UPI0003B5CC5C|nr:hypothetical protein [Ruania albidiflava]